MFVQLVIQVVNTADIYFAYLSVVDFFKLPNVP